MTDYLNKKQMSSLLESAGIKPSLEALGFDGLNRSDAKDHRFEDIKVEEGQQKITGGYEYQDESGKKRYFFTISGDKMEAREIQCW